MRAPSIVHVVCSRDATCFPSHWLGLDVAQCTPTCGVSGSIHFQYDGTYDGPAERPENGVISYAAAAVPTTYSYVRLPQISVFCIKGAATTMNFM